jgi:DNA-binding response OmpR family regulator
MEKKKVMIVDDEIDFLKIIKVNLEKTGKYEVQTLADTAGIIERVKSFNPHIILLDILMPKVDGVELCKMFSEDPAVSGIPIITLSALDTDNYKLIMFMQGVVDFLVKPIEVDELIAKIEKAL